MCLYHNEQLTKKLKKEMKNGKKIFWKVYRKDEDGIYPPCYGSSWRAISKPGVVKAEPKQDFSGLVDFSSIGPGAIHVFLDKKAATDFVRYKTDVVIPVTCRVEDLISCGTSWGQGLTAAFKQIEILKKDFPKTK